MDIKESNVSYMPQIPIALRLCRIRHANPHFHSDSLELVYCLQGQIRLHAGFQHVNMHAGEIFSIDCRDIHYLESDTDNLVLLVHLDLTNLDEPFDFLQYVYFACETVSCQPYQVKPLKWLEQTFLALAYDETAPCPVIDRKKAANKIMGLLLKSFNFYTYLNKENYINPPLYERFSHILIYCHQNFMNKITISQLAKSEHVARNYFSQFMRTTTFKSFNNMINYIRCYESEYLLLTTDLPVAEIGYSCGFSDPKYFYANFKRWFGCTPTTHRNRIASFMEMSETVETIPFSAAGQLLKDLIADWLAEKAALEL